MKWVLILLFIPNLLFGNDFARCEELKDDCEYYSCISEIKNCPRTSYPLNFGRRYCLRYTNRLANFSLTGKTWVENVKRCLIQEMMNFEEGLSCRGLRQKAFRSHIPCYVENGFCELGLRDKRQIIKTIWPSFKSLGVLKDGLSILQSCRFSKP